MTNSNATIARGGARRLVRADRVDRHRTRRERRRHSLAPGARAARRPSNDLCIVRGAFCGSLRAGGSLPAICRTRARRAPGDALDIAIPAATLALAPAPYGFAAYFSAWHSPRHLAVVLQRDGRGGSARVRLVRFVRESLRNVAISGVVGAVAYAAFRDRDPHEIFVALTLAVTVPHEAAVWYAERAANLRERD